MLPLGGELAVVHFGGTQLKFRASALETYWSHRIRSYGQKDFILLPTSAIQDLRAELKHITKRWKRKQLRFPQ